jgi:hypothetical protein
VRWLLLFVDEFFCGLVGLITVLATHPHRRVGDMAAGTYVVSTADVGRPIVGAPSYTGAYAPPAAGGWQPAPGQPAWGTPPPTGAQPWGAAPPTDQPTWGATPPATWGAPPPAPEQPAQWSAPPPAPEKAGWAAPPAPPSPSPAAPPPSAPSPAPGSSPGNESWWDKAVTDDAKESEE